MTVQTSNQRPPKHTILAYGGISFGYGLLWHSVILFLLFYFTDVLEIPPFTAGLIIALALLWDAISDPVMGLLSITLQGRIGGYKNWIKLSAFPFAFSFVLLFLLGPIEVPTTVKTLLCFIALVLFNTFCTTLNIPFGIIAFNISRNTLFRNRLAAARLFFSILAAFFAASFLLPLSKVLGSNETWGFLITSVIFACISYLALRVSVKNLDMPETHVQNRQQPISNAFHACFRNKPLLIVLSVALIFVFCSAIHSRTLFYVIKYNLGREDLISFVIGGCAFLVIVFTPIWAWLAAKISKRLAALIGFLLVAIFGSLLLLFPNSDLEFTLMMIFAMNVGIAALPVMFFSMIPDTIEINEFKFGIAYAGLVYGLAALTMKFGGSLANFILGLLMDKIGFVANQDQSLFVLDSLYVIMALFPVIGAALSAILIIFYPLDANYHQRLTRVLQKRGDALLR